MMKNGNYNCEVRAERTVALIETAQSQVYSIEWLRVKQMRNRKNKLKNVYKIFFSRIYKYGFIASADEIRTDFTG